MPMLSMSAKAGAGAGSVGSGAAPAAPAGGTNPFWVASNWYAEKMNNIITANLGAAQQFFNNQQVNAGQFLRGVRLIVRSSGATAGTAPADGPYSLFPNAELDNVDGSNILYPMPGYKHLLRIAYSYPWFGDPTQAYDYANSVNPSFTLFLTPEIRHGAGVLANTDSRNLYKYSVTLNTAAGMGVSSGTCAVTVTPFMDAWAQPDAADLQGTPNQPIPPGVNLQTLARTQTIPLNAAGADNILVSTLTGNMIRWETLILRDSNGARQDYVTDPIRIRIDNRNLGTVSPDELFQWNSDFYGRGGAIMARPTGVYLFPHFYNPGTMQGQGWQQTNSATQKQWEFTTLSTGTNLPGTIDYTTHEVVPLVGAPAELFEL